MSDKPEALRLADELEARHQFSLEAGAAAAELRRLHELALEQQGKIYALEMARSMEQKTAKLKQDALLMALRLIAGRCDAEPIYKIARAAIAAVEGAK